MADEILPRLKYPHEHLFRMQTFIEAKNATILTANFVLLANFDKMPLGAVYFKIALVLAFVSAAISVAYSLSSFFPNVRGTSDQKSVLFLVTHLLVPEGGIYLIAFKKARIGP